MTFDPNADEPTPASCQAVNVSHESSIAFLSLNRPDKLNAFNSDIVEGLIAGIEAAIRRESRLLVISGEGRAFSAGFDLSGLDGQSDGDLALRFIRIEIMLRLLSDAPMATMAMVHGKCFGAAADVLCVCDKRVAEAETMFRFPGLHFGVTLGTRRLASLIGADGARSVLETTRVIAADEGMRLGIVQACLPREDWPGLIDTARQDTEHLSKVAQANMLREVRGPTLDSDLAALVRSVSVPGLKSRIRNYLNTMKR